MEILRSLLFMLNEMSPYILLGFLVAGLMHAYVSQRTFARHLSGTGWGAVIKAAAIGIPLPLCSCGVLPAAIGMRRSGASRAASTSFLIATPQTGVDSIAATWSLLGPAFAIVRPIAALVTALFGGLAVGKVERTMNGHDHKHTHDHDHNGHCHDSNCSCKDTHCDCDDDCEDCDDDCDDDCCSSSEAPIHRSFGAKFVDALRYGYVDLVASIGNWLVVGLFIAALITVYVPADFFAIFADRPALSMLLVLVIAIPMYVCATGSIPIALSLMLKGLSPGTAFVLLMAGPAVNFASLTLISKEFGRKPTIIYIASIVLGSVLFGLGIDYLLPASWFAIADVQGAATCELCDLDLFSTICSAILVLLLAYAFYNNFKPKKSVTFSAMSKVYIVKGMNCSHCQAAVTNAISSVKGVSQVDVDLASGRATVEGSHSAEDLIKAVQLAGFDAQEQE